MIDGAHVPPALARTPGPFGAVVVGIGAPGDVRAVARALIARSDARLLVAVSPFVAKGTDAGELVIDAPFEGTPFPVSRHDLFVQVAADEGRARDALVHVIEQEMARRGCVVVERALLASIEPGAREPFGFVDPFRPHTVPTAVVDRGPARGSAALVHQAWTQDVARFARLDLTAQTRAMGISRDGTPVVAAPPSAHVTRMRGAYALARRGLPSEARTGLHFVAHAASEDVLARALRAVSRGDALLDFAYPTTGGAFITIPDVDALTPRRRDRSTPRPP